MSKNNESRPPAAVVAARQAIIQTSTGGRGFIVRAGEDRYVITAAHCLPKKRRSQ